VPLLSAHVAEEAHCRTSLVCCSVLQCVAVCCSVLQCVAYFRVMSQKRRSPETSLFVTHFLTWFFLFCESFFDIIKRPVSWESDTLKKHYTIKCLCCEMSPRKTLSTDQRHTLRHRHRHCQETWHHKVSLKTLSTNTVKRDLCNIMFRDMAPQSRNMTPQSAYSATRALIHMSAVVATWMSATWVSVMSHMSECVPHEWVLCYTWVRATWMSATWVSECNMRECYITHEWVP